MKKKKGFTLVELIVVLVILTLLMAFIVPSFIGYIRKAKTTKALMACRQTVTAAQGRLTELYGYGKPDEIEETINESEEHKTILKLAEAEGSIEGTIVVKNNRIQRLVYKHTDGVVVVYDLSENPVYQVNQEAELSITALEQWRKKATEVTTELGKGGTSLSREKVIAEMGELVKVDSYQKKGSLYEKEELYWRPYYLGDLHNPQVVLYAADKDSGHAGWNAKMVYVDGEIYQCTKKNNQGKLSGAIIAKWYEDAKNTTALKEWLDENHFVKVK